MDPFLQVDEGYVEAEYVTRETGYVFQCVASVGYGEEPVHCKRPSEILSVTFYFIGRGNLQPDQGHKSKIVRASWSHDIVNST